MASRQASLIVAGIFFCLSIFAAVLACALWNFQEHPAFDNWIYGGGIAAAFIMNVSIATALVQGVRWHLSQLFLPYIVCATFHLFVSCILLCYFAYETVIEILVQNPDAPSMLYSPMGLLIFTLLTFFWAASIVIVRNQRDVARKASGEHVLFTDAVDYY